MSYCRLPYYIYDAGDRVNFNFDSSVDNDMLDVFLYKLVLVYPNEFKERILNGRKIIMDWLDEQINADDEPYQGHKKENHDYKNWLLDKERDSNILSQILSDGGYYEDTEQS